MIDTTVLPQTIARKLPRCKNCRFWMEARNGLCEKFEYSEAWTIDSDFASASYDDSGVHTGSEFGCIHFEVKDEL